MSGRKAAEPGFTPRYAEGRASRQVGVRAKSLVGSAFSPEADGSCLFDELECLFAVDGIDILIYSEVAYVGKKSGPNGARGIATSPPSLRNVCGRIDCSRTRGDHAVESSNFLLNSNFLLKAGRPFVPPFMGSLHVQEEASSLDKGHIARGGRNKEKERPTGKE